MKRNKHVLINLTEDQFNMLLFIANKENRKISDIAYLIIIESLNNKAAQYTDIKNSGFKKLTYNNNYE